MELPRLAEFPNRLGRERKRSYLRLRVSAYERNMAKTLPKILPGVVCAQWVRCGRPSCRCAGGRLHGPYHYRFWREGGRLRKAYVKRSELDQVRARCQARQQLRQNLNAWWDKWRRLTALVLEVEQE
jgi:hypothetical protein